MPPQENKNLMKFFFNLSIYLLFYFIERFVILRLGGQIKQRHLRKTFFVYQLMAAVC